MPLLRGGLHKTFAERLELSGRFVDLSRVRPLKDSSSGKLLCAKLVIASLENVRDRISHKRPDWNWPNLYFSFKVRSILSSAQ